MKTFLEFFGAMFCIFALRVGFVEVFIPRINGANPPIDQDILLLALALLSLGLGIVCFLISAILRLKELKEK